MKRVLLWLGVGQIGRAIVRRIGASMKIVVGDANLKQAQREAKELSLAGFDIVATHADASSKKSIMRIIDFARSFGEIAMLVDAASVTPPQASAEKILQTDIFGTAVLLEEIGKVIACGGCGIAVSEQPPHPLPALSPEQDEWLACAPPDELLKLEVLRPENIRDARHAYQLARHCIGLRVMAEAVKWGKRSARISVISHGFVAAPPAAGDLSGSCGNFIKKELAGCPAGRPGTPDEVADLAQFVMSERGAFVSGSDFLIDGGADAARRFGDLRPDNRKNIKLYLTSSPIGTYRAEGVDYSGLNPKNGLIDALKEDWPAQPARCLFIAANPDDCEQNAAIADDFAKRLNESGLRVDAFDVCDAANPETPVRRLTDYDFLLLGGGHVPTENDFFREIGLFERIRDYRGIVMGISAGTMNCAEIVYAQPELEGEATDPDYRRFIPGLGLTPCQILPHFQSVKDDILDGMRLFEDITFADSFGNAFIAIPDGSFVLQRDGLPILRGKGYLVAEGQIAQICEDGETLPLD